MTSARRWSTLGTLLLLATVCALARSSAPDDDVDPDADDEYDANGNATRANDTDYDGAMPDTPAATTRPWPLAGNNRPPPTPKCELPVSSECRCVFQQSLGGFKVTCEVLALKAVPTELVSQLPARTVHLSFRRNMIRQIGKMDLRSLTSLKVLDLSNNLIDEIEPGSFEDLLQLTKLNLSDNRLQQINASLFTGLASLERLSLSANKLQTVPRSVIRSLPNLRTIDFTSMSLICDCRLNWMVDFASRVRIDDNPVCGKPAKLRNKKVRKLAFDQLGCDSDDQSVYDTPNSPIFLELSPSRDQFSLQGDPLSITCRAHNLIEAQLQSERSRLFWEHSAESTAATRLGATLILPGEHANGLVVQNFMNRDPQQTNSYQSARQLAEGNYFQADSVVATRPNALASPPSSSAPVLFWTELNVRSLDMDHSGVWKCVLTTPVRNFTKAISVRVLGRDLAQCEPLEMNSPSGLFSWQRTLAHMASSQPCPLGAARLPAAASNDQKPLLVSMNTAMAHHRCDAHGNWSQLDISACRNMSQLSETIDELLSYRIDMTSMHQLLAYVQRILIHARPAIGFNQLRGIVTLLERTVQPFRDAANLSVSASGVMTSGNTGKIANTVLSNNVGTAYADEQRSADDTDTFDRLFAVVDLLGSLDSTLLSEAEQREQITTRIVRLVHDVAYAQVLLNRSVREFVRSATSFVVVALRISAVQFAPLETSINTSSKWLTCRVLKADASFVHRCDPTDMTLMEQSNVLDNDYSRNESDSLEVARVSIPFGTLLADKQIASEIDRESAIAMPQTARKLYETSLIIDEDPAVSRKSKTQFRSVRNRKQADSNTLSTPNSAMDERSVLVQIAYFASTKLFPFSGFTRSSPFVPLTGLLTVRIGGLQSIAPLDIDDRVLLRFAVRNSNGSANGAMQRKSSGHLVGMTLSLLPRRLDSTGWLAGDQCELVAANDTHLRCSVFGLWAATVARSVDRTPPSFGVLAFDAVVYVGALTSVACVCAILITYVSFRRSIKMSYKLRHATMNLNADFVALVVTFLFGTLRTELPVICTCVGAIIHFLTLSIVCWFSIWAFVLFRKSHKFRTYMKRPAHQTLLENANELFVTQQCGALPTGSTLDTPNSCSRRSSRTRSKPRQRFIDESQSQTQPSTAPLLTMTSSITSASAAQTGNEPQPSLGQSFMVRSRVHASRRVSTARWKKLVRLYIFAYGISAIVVIVTLSLTASTYLQGGCAPANASLWAPAGVLTVLNVILFVSIMSSVCSSSFDRYLDHFKRHRHSYERFVAASSAQSCTCTVSTPLGNGNATMTATASFASNTLRQTTPPLAVPTVSASFADGNSLVHAAPRRTATDAPSTNGANTNGRHAVVSCSNLADPSGDSLFNNSDFTTANAAHRSGSGRCAAHHGNAAMTASSILLFVYSVKQSNKEQFYTLLALYVLYAAAWCFASFCVLELLHATPTEPLPVNDLGSGPTASGTWGVRDVVFAYLFAICVTAFGIVELVYFAILRGDVRSAWIDTLKRRRLSSRCCISSSGSYDVSPLRCESQPQRPSITNSLRTEPITEQPFRLATPTRKRSTERFAREPQPTRPSGAQPSFVEPTYVPICHAPTVSVTANQSVNGNHQQQPPPPQPLPPPPPLGVALSQLPPPLPPPPQIANVDVTGAGADVDAETVTTRPSSSPSAPHATSATPTCPENSAYTSPHDSRVFTIADVDLLSDVAQSVARNRSEKQKQLASVQNVYEARRRRERASHDRSRHPPASSRHERTRTRPRNPQLSAAANCKSPHGGTPLRADRNANVHTYSVDERLDVGGTNPNVIASVNAPAVDNAKSRAAPNGGVHYAAAAGRVHFGEPSSQSAVFGTRHSAVPHPVPVEDEYIAVRSIPNHVLAQPHATPASTAAAAAPAGVEPDSPGNADCASCAESSCSECERSASVASLDSLKQETCV